MAGNKIRHLTKDVCFWILSSNEDIIKTKPKTVKVNRCCQKLIPKRRIVKHTHTFDVSDIRVTSSSYVYKYSPIYTSS